MQVKATIANGYRNRLLLITIGALLYAAWAFYDATEKYPNKLDARQTFMGLQDKYPDTWKDEWAKAAEENGWDPAEPEEIAEKDIMTQWVLFGITCPIGLYCLTSLLIWSRRYVACDQTGLSTHGGVSIPFDKITRIDAARWETKGIAYVYYDLGQGEKSLMIDDWKYERQPSDEIFSQLRSKVDGEKIESLGTNIQAAETPDEPQDTEPE